MGEKQIEIDKRLLRKRISSIRRELEEVMLLVDVIQNRFDQLFRVLVAERLSRGRLEANGNM